MPHFDRFDIVSAWCLWLSHNHGGQGSEEYRRLSKIATYFRPGLLMDSGILPTDNSREIYDNLVLRNLRLVSRG